MVMASLLLEIFSKGLNLESNHPSPWRCGLPNLYQRSAPAITSVKLLLEEAGGNGSVPDYTSVFFVLMIATVHLYYIIFYLLIN